MSNYRQRLDPSAGEYRAIAPTFTDGQVAPLQTDVNGALKISGTFSGGSISAIPPAFAPSTNPFTVVVAGDSATHLLLAANPVRPGILLKNQGSNDFWIGKTVTMTSGAAGGAAPTGTVGGLLLSPGDWVYLSGYVGAIYGYAVSAGVLAYWEG